MPTGTELVELHDTNGRKLNYVHVYYELFDNGEDAQFTLYAQDYFSAMACICDRDVLSAAVAGTYEATLTLNGDANSTGCDTGCFGGPVPTDWTMSVLYGCRAFRSAAPQWPSSCSG